MWNKTDKPSKTSSSKKTTKKIVEKFIATNTRTGFTGIIRYKSTFVNLLSGIPNY